VRAINLIPPEEQRGRVQARAGVLSYVLIGVLVAALAGITAMVVTSNQISDRRDEVRALEQRRDAAQSSAESLQVFTDFRAMQEARTATVTSLAQSRFDWERVLRELALVLPEDVWLVDLEGTVSPAVQTDGGVEVTGRQSVPGPALELVGCTVSQDAVGSFAAALRDIDGVTRVGVFKSELPDAEAETTETTETTEATAAPATDGAGDGDCRTRDFITRFEIVAAFDEVPVPEIPDPSVPAAPTGTGDQPPADGSVEEGVQEGQEAAEIAPGI
jgi:Tfp pilus assembly protein PilN